MLHQCQLHLLCCQHTVGVVVVTTYFGKVGSTLEIGSVHNGGGNDVDTILKYHACDESQLLLLHCTEQRQYYHENYWAYTQVT